MMLTWIADISGSRKARYRCDCGNVVNVFKANASRGHTVSCGCYRKRVTSERSTTHGHKRGGMRTRAYVAWMNMCSRCDNNRRPDYANYGGRGIRVCDRWRSSFENFLSDMGDPDAGMTLDRIDNERGYSPDNCRWATRAEQNLNKRSCVRYDLNGESLTLAEWSRKTGIGRVTMLKRIQAGVPLDVALTFKGNLCSLRRAGSV